MVFRGNGEQKRKCNKAKRENKRKEENKEIKGKESRTTKMKENWEFGSEER